MLDKIIQKRLDKYYSNKLIEKIIDSIKCIWDLDVKTKRNKEDFIIYVKKRKYKDSEYKAIIRFGYDEAIIHLMRINERLKCVNELVECYSKNN